MRKAEPQGGGRSVGCGGSIDEGGERMEERETGERHPLDISDRIWDMMSEKQKELARVRDVSNKKIEALKDYILEECDRQGFTVGDVDQLIRDLTSSLSDRRRRVDDEPFIK